jgi:23S rRNA G2445 N2-methylase RlmL
LGTDLDPEALDRARVNLRSVGVEAELVLGDCTRFEAGKVSLVLSNPPMGRRVHRSADLGELLERVVAQVGRVLDRRGRFVWLSPLPSCTLEAAGRAGLVPTFRQEVDMGGFTAELQRFERR